MNHHHHYHHDEKASRSVKKNSVETSRQSRVIQELKPDIQTGVAKHFLDSHDSSTGGEYAWAEMSRCCDLLG